MRVPYEWLKDYVDARAAAEEIAAQLTMGGLEVEGIEASDTGPVLDVYVTPNRGDCACVVGVAREVAALCDLPLKAPNPPASRSGGAAAEQVSVTIEAPELCPRYAARLVHGVTVGPSPGWLQQRLEAAGQRPINNVVDVANYVMLEIGQPLHAFDFDRLAGRRIVVRRAGEGETLRTLDAVDRSLAPEMLVIADGEKPVAIAGVIGGANSEVSAGTTSILLESAHFDWLCVRRTARALGVRTEASYRFERVVDPNGVVRAVDRACELLARIGRPEAVAGVVDVYPKPIEPRRLRLRASRASALLGMKITPKVAAASLSRLGFHAERAPEGRDVVNVQVPTFRPDITLEEDLVEEVGRVYGYANIPETLPTGATTPGADSAEGRLLDRIRDELTRAGLQEVVCHTLTGAGPDDSAAAGIAVRNALSAEIGTLRGSLIPGLLDAARRNASHGRSSLGVFEIGRVWTASESDADAAPEERIRVAGLLCGPLSPETWQRDTGAPPADFSAIRGLVERLFTGSRAGPARFLRDPYAARLGLHPGRSATVFVPADRAARGAGEARWRVPWILHTPYGSFYDAGVVGEVHPRVAANLGARDRVYVFEIDTDVIRAALPQEPPQFRPLSRFPAVNRDLAPRVEAAVTYAEVEDAVRAAEAPWLEAIRLTDLFHGPPLPAGIKSFTLSCTFRAADKTLADAEVDASLERIRASLRDRCAARFPE